MAKTKILLIEDDKSLARLIKGAMDQTKFEITVALEADEGIDKAMMEKPAIIILDVLLPAKSGFACLREIKSNSKIKKIPVIILSNLGQAEEIRKALELGAADYIVKADFSIDEIIKKILKYLK